MDIQETINVARTTLNGIKSGKLVWVVRCKNCKYWLPLNRFHQDYHPGRGECELNCWVRDDNWFCADGEYDDS